MKKFISIVGLIALIGLAVYLKIHKSTSERALGGGGPTFSYITAGASQATSTVGVYSWSNIFAADSSYEYASLCNNSVVANEAIYLSFGTGSTTANIPAKPYGMRLPSGQCYELNSDKLFYGDIYAIASSATTTVLTVKAKHY